ncbi:uronyl 2-sulfotransferase-like [Tigriopus californicus]|uniref:uronyl 2-sulfotransferase-like n=1 Tax=Tigriopus californicus TaxID=6832 RepID=UPI0027DA67E9|nr:uronyl 2-sulfotransferase-like [Tigriopus californicus]
MKQEWLRLFFVTISGFLIFLSARNNTKLPKQQTSSDLGMVMDPCINVTDDGNISLALRTGREPLKARSIQSEFKRNPNHLIFARVPKTGTTTLTFLMREIFRHTYVKNVTNPGFRHSSTPKHQEFFVKRYFSRPNEKKAFLSHIRFIDFRAFNRTPPIWISQVRDPSERFISRYHFVRRRDRLGFQTLLKKRGLLEAEKWHNMSVDYCVSRGLPECILKPRQEYEPSPITYLCGFDSECSRHGSRWALAKAKANVLEHFSMVGVLEEFQQSLEIMERNVPQLLQDISKQEVPKKNETPRPNHINETTREILKSKLALEYDLYEFIKATFLSRN